MRPPPPLLLLLLLLASTTTCVSARPSPRLSGDTEEAQQLPGQNMSVSCENANQTLADSAPSLESRSSQSRSQQTANSSSTSPEAPSAPSVTLNSTSEDAAALPGLSMAEFGVGFPSRGCSLATCSIADLASKLQAGEETAGASALDSSGFGRK